MLNIVKIYPHYAYTFVFCRQTCYMFIVFIRCLLNFILTFVNINCLISISIFITIIRENINKYAQMKVNTLPSYLSNRLSLRHTYTHSIKPMQSIQITPNTNTPLVYDHVTTGRYINNVRYKIALYLYK